MKGKLAVFELHHLGDAILALPFLRGAAAQFDVVVACRPSVCELLNFVAPQVEALALADRWIARWQAVRAGLRLRTSDAAVCVWPDPRVHALMLGTGAGMRVGFAVAPRNFYAPRHPQRARRLAFGRLAALALDVAAGGRTLTHPLFKRSSSQHHLESWVQVAQALGLGCDFQLPWFGEPPPRRSPGPLHFLFHAGGRLPSKRWPVPHFERLLRDVVAPRGWQATIVHFPGEPCPQPQAAGQRMAAPKNFAELAALFWQADAIVCNDSFPAHFAAAMGKPVVAIFGSGEPAWFAPYQSERYAVHSSACPWRPCLDHCLMPTFLCLESLPVEAVQAAMERLVADWQNRWQPAG